MDQAFLVKVLPLHVGASSLLPMLTSLLSQLASTLLRCRRRTATLWVELCLVLVQLASTFCNEANYPEVATMLCGVMPVFVNSLNIACDFRIVPPPRDVTNAVLVLAMTLMTSARASFERAEKEMRLTLIGCAICQAAALSVCV